jgi:hypothetical protein
MSAVIDGLSLQKFAHAFVDRFRLRFGDDLGPHFFLAHLFEHILDVCVRGGVGPIGYVVNGVRPHAEGARDQLRRHAFGVEGIDGDSLGRRELALARDGFQTCERVLIQCDVHFASDSNADIWLRA